jgi:hypothetical protein
VAAPTPPPPVTPPPVTPPPPVTTFSDGSNAAPALVQFRGTTYMAWSGDQFSDGSLNVAAVTQSPSGYQLTSKVNLSSDVSPGLSPALAVFNNQLYLAWTEPNGHLNVTCSTDGIHFGNQVTLDQTSKVAPSLAAFNGRLCLGWTGLDGRLNLISTPDGIDFGNQVILNQTSGLAPALAAYDGRLWIAWTGGDSGHHLNVISSSDGVHFPTAAFETSQSSLAAPALAVEQSAVACQPDCLVIGWTGVGNMEPNYMTLTDGQFSAVVTIKQEAVNGLALVSPSAGQLDFAWAGNQSPVRQLNFLQA